MPGHPHSRLLRSHERTGRFMFRRTWWGRQVLYIEVKKPAESPGSWHLVWRPAIDSEAQTIVQKLNGIWF